MRALQADAPLLARAVGKTNRAIALACHRARHGDSVLMVVPDVAVAKRQVLAHTGGAWPIGLRVVALEGLAQYP